MHYLQKISDDFNFGQKKCPKIKLKYLQYCIKLLNSSKARSFLYGANTSQNTALDT